MEDTCNTILRALAQAEDRRFLLQVESDILHFLSSFRSRPSESPPLSLSCTSRGVASAPSDTSSSSSRAQLQQKKSFEPCSLWWCCSCAQNSPQTVAASPEEVPGCRLAGSDSTELRGGDSHSSFHVTPRESLRERSFCLEFPRLSSYHRFLIHVTGQRFGLRSTSHPMWATEDGSKNVRLHHPSLTGAKASSSTQCSCGSLTSALPGIHVPLLLYHDFLPDKERASEPRADGGVAYCFEGSRRLGVEPLSSNLMLNHATSVHSMNDTDDGSSRSTVLAAGSEKRQVKDSLEFEANASPTRILEGKSSEGKSHGVFSNESPSSSSQTPSRTGELKRKGRGTFGYRRQDADKEPENDTSMHADDPSVEKDRQEMRGRSRGTAGKDVTEESGEVQVAAQHDYTSWEVRRGVPDENKESTSFLWGEGNSRNAQRPNGPYFKSKNVNDRPGKAGGNAASGTLEPSYKHILVIQPEKALTASTTSREECMTPLSCGETTQAALTQSAECEACSQVRALFCGCCCIRSVGDLVTFIAIFYSEEDAKRALRHGALDISRTVEGNSPHADGGSLKVQVRSVLPLQEADPVILQKCSWEIGDAGKRRRGARVNASATHRLISHFQGSNK